MTLKIQPTAAPVGAIVTGLYLEDLSRSDQCGLYRAFLHHGVLAFRHVNADATGQMTLLRIFGEPDRHPIEHLRLKEEANLIGLAANDGRPVMEGDPEADKLIGQIPWHMDQIYTEKPDRGTSLRAVVLPESGGDTSFIDTAGVYRALPYKIRCKIQGLQIVHGYARTHCVQNMVGGDNNLFPDVIHPLVYVHPESGLPVLNIGPSTAEKIVGLPDEEGFELLHDLVDFATREDPAYRHQWEAGDMLLWDNWRPFTAPAPI